MRDPFKRDEYEHRHEQFQFGTNPMMQTHFEHALAVQERLDRDRAKREYIRGVQGPDGGSFPCRWPS